MIWLFMVMAAQGLIENGLKPAKPLKVELVKDLVLGTDPEDDHQIFTTNTSLVTNEKGDMYIMDPGNFRVAIFDKEGKFRKEFGTQGQGPGEFQGMSDIGIDTKGNIFVFDIGSKRMTVFDSEGKYLRDATFAPGIQALTRPYFFENGNMMFFTVQTDAQMQQKYDLSLYDSELKLIKALVVRNHPRSDWSRVNDPAFWVEFLVGHMEGLSKGAPVGVGIDGKTLVASLASDYRGEVFDQEGNSLGQWAKKYKPKPFSDEAKKIGFEALWQGMCQIPFLAQNMPKPVFDKAFASAQADFVPPIASMCRLGDGFAVVNGYDIVKQTGNLEIFNREGRLIATAPYQGPLRNTHGNGNHFYVVGLDDEDNFIINRYLVKGL